MYSTKYGYSISEFELVFLSFPRKPCPKQHRSFQEKLYSNCRHSQAWQWQYSYLLIWRIMLFYCFQAQLFKVSFIIKSKETREKRAGISDTWGYLKLRAIRWLTFFQKSTITYNKGVNTWTALPASENR